MGETVFAQQLDCVADRMAEIQNLPQPFFQLIAGDDPRLDLNTSDDEVGQ